MKKNTKSKAAKLMARDAPSTLGHCSLFNGFSLYSRPSFFLSSLFFGESRNYELPLYTIRIGELTKSQPTLQQGIFLLARVSSKAKKKSEKLKDFFPVKFCT